VTYTDKDDDLDVISQSLGRIAPSYEIDIVDRDGTTLPKGRIGEVLVRGPCVMAGYYGRPQATAEMIDENGWLHSGDLGRIDEWDRLNLVGRIKDMFKSGGYNIYPREIELVLESHPSVSQVQLVSVPDSIYYEVGVAFLVPKPGRRLQEQEISAFCRERLANYKVPKAFIIRRSLPMLPVGKIDKVALRAEAIRLRASADR
jgi:fatty-acyl-CoA synthase